LATAGNCTLRDKKIVKWARKPFAALGGAAVEPEKIKAGAERPADFNKFWQDGVKAYKNAEVIITPAPELAQVIAPHKALQQRLEGYNLYRVESKFADKSGSITGFLAVPAAPGKYPIIAGVPGAGAGTIYPGTSYVSGKPAIQLFMNVHPYPTASTGAEQKKRYDEYNESLQTPQGINRIYTMYKADNRDEYIYRKVWLALNRALEHVMTMKEFDGKNIAAVGSSQGGGSALALAGINSKVTCVVANVPALCDHGGWKAGRAPGWPHLHNNWKGKADAAAAYFDAANFAMNIKVPALVSVGYIDTTCSPSSVYAAYNNLTGKKSIYPMYRLGHTATSDFSKAASKFLNEQFSGK
ncbi:MAG: acetylxylan esterase, partial [Lentisphaeria bacterium]|nr:acetylxylan esterase [Lentisphaeria bacterium]